MSGPTIREKNPFPLHFPYGPFSLSIHFPHLSGVTTLLNFVFLFPLLLKSPIHFICVPKLYIVYFGLMFGNFISKWKHICIVVIETVTAIKYSIESLFYTTSYSEDHFFFFPNFQFWSNFRLKRFLDLQNVGKTYTSIDPSPRFFCHL